MTLQELMLMLQNQLPTPERRSEMFQNLKDTLNLKQQYLQDTQQPKPEGYVPSETFDNPNDAPDPPLWEFGVDPNESTVVNNKDLKKKKLRDYA